jgi:hypothetical protein
VTAWEWLAERRLQQAIDDGLLENLPGQGRPLPAEDDRLVPEEWRLAFHVLKSSGHAPAWIELRKEVEARLEAASRDLSRARGEERVSARARAYQRFTLEVQEVNQLIDLANLRAGHPSLHRPRVDPQRLAEALLNAASDHSDDSILGRPTASQDSA